MLDKKASEAARRIIEGSPAYCVPHTNEPHEILSDGKHHKPTYILIDWSEPGIGFGQAYIYWDSKVEKVCLQSEGMGKEFVKKMLCRLVDDAELVE